MSDNWEPEVVEETTPPPTPFGMLEARPASPALQAPPTPDAPEVIATSEVTRFTATSDGIVVSETVETVEIYRSEEGDFIVDVVDTVETVITDDRASVTESVDVTAIPVPRPAPTPAGLRRPRTTAPVAARQTDPARFGRIDDDGTAWLTTPNGDVCVGQWAAGTRDEGLAFFGRKFDDIQVEVDLAAHRLREGRGVDTAKAAVDHARAALAAPAFIGDVVQLASSCDEVDALIAEQRARREEARRQQREEALAAREAIVVEAESLAESRQWKARALQGAPRAVEGRSPS